MCRKHARMGRLDSERETSTCLWRRDESRVSTNRNFCKESDTASTIFSNYPPLLFLSPPPEPYKVALACIPIVNS